jgi:hypothetical protein
MRRQVFILEFKNRTLPKSQGLQHRSVYLSRDAQPAIPLVLSQSISRRWTKAAINRSPVITFPGQGCLDLADPGIPIVAVILGLRGRLRVFVRSITVVIIGIGAVWVITESPGINPRIDEHPRVVAPMAPAPIPKVVAAPIPIATGPGQRAASIIKTLRAKSGVAIYRQPPTRSSITKRVRRGKAPGRGRVSSITKRSRGGKTLG